MFDMNKERLEQLAAHIEALPPEKFDMSKWCGTPCCIGGHAEKLFKLDPTEEDTLGLDYDKLFSLFYPIIRGHHYSDPGLANNTQAANVIRHLIKTGKVEWERFV
jgi:hypothetical protein